MVSKVSVFVGGCLALLFLLAASHAHAASFIVCNKAKEPINVAIGYEDKDLGMVSEGWWKLTIGDCVDIKPADGKDHQYYFLYGRGERGGNWSSFDPTEEGAFCVIKNNFKFVNRDFENEGKLECERRRATVIKFQRLDTFVAGQPVPKYTYSLTRTSN
jgi:uncharacterized membrane protein